MVDNLVEEICKDCVDRKLCGPDKLLHEWED